MFYKISLIASGNHKRQVIKDSKKRQDKRKGLRLQAHLIRSEKKLVDVMIMRTNRMLYISPV